MFYFYESEIENKLITALKDLYKLKDESALLSYLYLKYYIFTPNDSLDGIAGFIIDELQLDNTNGELSYRDFTFKAYMVNIMFQNIYKIKQESTEIINGQSVDWLVYIEHLQKDIEKKAAADTKNFTHYPNFKDLCLYFELINLNELFGAVKKYEVPQIRHLKQIKHIDEPVGFEDRCRRYLDDLSYSTKFILDYKEKDIEDLISRNLNLIEDGMTFIGRQVPITDGFIDILAKDKSGQFVIIEVKIKNDERLIWQCIYYPLQFKKEKGLESVRMITITPSYNYKIKAALCYIGSTEMLTFTPIIDKGLLKSVEISKEKI